MLFMRAAAPRTRSRWSWPTASSDGAVVLLDDLGEAFDDADRRAQVVRDDVAERCVIGFAGRVGAGEAGAGCRVRGRRRRASRHVAPARRRTRRRRRRRLRRRRRRRRRSRRRARARSRRVRPGRGAAGASPRARRRLENAVPGMARIVGATRRATTVPWRVARHGPPAVGSSLTAVRRKCAVRSWLPAPSRGRRRGRIAFHPASPCPSL